MSRALQVYLTRTDWMEVAATFEARVPVCYVRHGPVRGDVERWESVASAEDFGVASTGDEATNPQFLLLPADAAPVARVAERRAGADRRIVDRQDNQQSLLVRPGGAFGARLVLVGEVAPARGDAWAERARRELEAALRGATREVQGFFVGEEAMQRLRAGARLTPYIDGDTLYDLKAP
ncbi:MAG: hypothetical protein VX044_08110 [Planctomycetota bacterium]|nr:hypothetical protein [Planctomycetota bacterium]